MKWLCRGHHRTRTVLHPIPCSHCTGFRAEGVE